MIDLAEDGYIKPHVDSIKVGRHCMSFHTTSRVHGPSVAHCASHVYLHFITHLQFSGRVVAGVSLLSPSIMRFQEEHGESVIDAFLPRRSFYMMTYVYSCAV